uniref:Prolactin releasing hormone n=1 Tax=Erpetoichthys calabaricus TaxID=27687 RepID=A0A8C4T7U5_ERPCA
FRGPLRWSLKSHLLDVSLCSGGCARVYQPGGVPTYPDIDASWYTGRGIRPVGRFGRRASEVRRGSDYPSHRFCIPLTASLLGRRMTLQMLHSKCA